MVRAHVFISGFVQGVGFRHFIKREADKLNLVGWVRNLFFTEVQDKSVIGVQDRPFSSVQGKPDNRVEAVFQGEKENIKKVIDLCKKGPFLSEVKNIEVRWEEGEESFEVFEIVI